MEEESSDYTRGVDGSSSSSNPSRESHGSRHSGNPDSAYGNQEVMDEPTGRVGDDQNSQNSTTGSNSSRTSYARPDLSNLSTGSSSAKIQIQNCPIARHIREGDVEGSVSGVDLQSLGGDCENSSIVTIVTSNVHTRDEDEDDEGYDESDEVNYEKLEEVSREPREPQRKHEINPHVQFRELPWEPRVLRFQGDSESDTSLSNDLSHCLDLASDLSLLDDVDDCCFMDDPMVAPSEFSSVTFFPEKIKVEGGGELEHIGDGYFLDRENGRLHYQTVGNVIHDFGSEGDHRGRFWTYNEFCVSNLRIEEHMLFSPLKFYGRDYDKGTLEYLTSLLEQGKSSYCHGFTGSFWDGVVNDNRVKCFFKGNEVSTMKRRSNDMMAMHKLLLVLFIRRKLELEMREQFPKAILGSFDEHGEKSDLMDTQPTKLITVPYFEKAKLFLLLSDEARRKLSFDCGEVTARVATLLPQETQDNLHRVDITNGILSLFSLFKSSFSSVSISKMGSKFELRGKFEGMFFLKSLTLSGIGICKILGLSDLKKLKRLELRKNQISKIEGLSELKNLEWLYLNSNQISKIEGLNHLKNLRELYLDNNQISKIEGLSALKNLKRLTLYNNQISKIEGLSELKILRRLDLENNQIPKIEGLNDLKNLELLDLNSIQISKIEGLSELKNLEYLYLKHNQISKIEGLSELKNLEELSLRDNQISKIEGLSDLRNLKRLYLNHNRIWKIEGLRKLKNLKELNLNKNQISKIEGLSELKNLESLDLINNQISIIEGLSDLEKLLMLDLRRNVNLKIPSGIKVDSMSGKILISQQSPEILSKNKEWQDLSKELEIRI